MNIKLGLIVVLSWLFLAGNSHAQRMTVKAQAPDKRIVTYNVYEKSKALLIGNVNYVPGSGWVRLPSIPKEIESIKKALIRQGFDEKDITIVVDAGAEKLRDTFREYLAEPVDRETRLLVFYAGHGFSSDEVTGFLVPVDAPAESDPKFQKSLLGMSEISGWSKLSRAKHVLFIFDSCFSGTIFLTRSRSLKPNQLFLNEADRPVRQFLTAGSAKEEVPSKSDFAEKLVEGLDGKADLYPDGVITANELGYWLKAEITLLGKQTPQYGSSTELAFRFGDTMFARSDGDLQGKSIPRTVDPRLMDAAYSTRGSSRSSLGVPSEVAPTGFQGVDVYYYQKLGDGPDVEEALDIAGIPFVKTRSSRPQEEATNGLACGPDVNVNALRAVANALISRGITLNTISPYAVPSAKLRRIEVLTNTLRTGPGLRVWKKGGITSAQVDALIGCPT